MKRIRCLVANCGLDGHDRGAKVICHWLRDAGMEVTYLGLYQTPEQVVQAAIQEDVDLIGLSILSGGQLRFTSKLLQRLEETGAREGRLLIVGGIFPAQDIPVLKEMGVDEVFMGVHSPKPIVDYIKENVKVKARE